MGRFVASAESVIHHSAEEVYAFVSDPHNWSKTYAGSSGLRGELTTPLQVGDTWTELVRIEEAGAEYSATWTLITAIPGKKFVFQQIGGVAAAADGSGGIDGITTISYTFTDAGDGATLFHRSLECELPRGAQMPGPLLIACASPAGIEGYHDAVARELDKLATARQ